MGKLRGKRLRVVHVEHVVFAVAEDKAAFHQVRLYATLADKHEVDADDVILLTDVPAIRFLIETPAGDVMDPAQANLLGATYGLGTNMSYYRFTLPLPLAGKPAQAGTWHALLWVDERILQQYGRRLEQSVSAWSARAAHGIRYSLSTHTYSNLRMEAQVSQNSLQPGATVTLRATLAEYGIPVAHRASIRAELQRPDSTQTTMVLAEVEPGVFETTTPATIHGVYRFRMLASGATMRGLPFTREQLLSAAVVVGGDNPFPTSDSFGRARDKQVCQLLECLLGPEALGRVLAERQVNLGAVRACLEEWCRARMGALSEEEIREREGTSSTGQIAAGTPAISSELIAMLAEVLKSAAPSPPPEPGQLLVAVPTTEAGARSGVQPTDRAERAMLIKGLRGLLSALEVAHAAEGLPPRDS
jgi:hypothetical protein